MVSPNPSIVVQAPAVTPSGYVQATRLEKNFTSLYPHVSFFHSLSLDMQIYSPFIKIIDNAGTLHPHPVFRDRDKIQGKVMLDPSCFQTGRLTISLEGVFECSPVRGTTDDGHSYKPTGRGYRHVFLSSSVAIPTSGSRSTIREAFSIRKRPSTSSLNAPMYRSCEFAFELPHGSRPGEKMPSTFSCKTPTGGLGGQARSEELEVAYRITTVWEASDGSANRTILEAPVLFHPDTDFQPPDRSTMEPKSWLDMPLIPERPIPFKCWVTFPHPRSFSRCSTIPYFVAFSTNIRSQSLVDEIITDATIAISLIRKVTVIPQLASQSQFRPDSPASDDSDGQSVSFATRSKRFRLSMWGPPRHTRDDTLSSTLKPLSELPQGAFSTLQTLQTQVFIGFPQRPRETNVSHKLPDGLYEGEIHLPKDMLPSVDWPGIGVKYYLDISVLVGQDDVRARVPISVC